MIEQHIIQDKAFCRQFDRQRIVRPLTMIHEDLALVFDCATGGYYFTVKGEPRQMVKLQMRMHDFLDYFGDCHSDDKHLST